MPGSPSRCGRPWLPLWLEPPKTPFPQRSPRCCRILLVYFHIAPLFTINSLKKKKNLCPGVFIIVNGSTTESSLLELRNNDNNDDNDNNNK